MNFSYLSSLEVIVREWKTYLWVRWLLAQAQGWFHLNQTSMDTTQMDLAVELVAEGVTGHDNSKG